MQAQRRQMCKKPRGELIRQWLQGGLPQVSALLLD
jgi:hypothetical protein